MKNTFTWVAVLVVREGKVLLLHRSGTKLFDGYWCAPGGKIDEGEFPMEAARRELKEEVGIDTKLIPSSTIFYKSREMNGEILDMIGLIFEAHEWPGEAENMELHKHDRMEWFDINQLPEKLLPIGKRAIEMYKKKQHYFEVPELISITNG